MMCVCVSTVCVDFFNTCRHATSRDSHIKRDRPKVRSLCAAGLVQGRAHVHGQKKKKSCIPLRQTRQQFQKHHPGQEKFIIFVLKLQSILICFQESIDLPFGCMYGRQKLSVLSGILFIFFLHCFALLCIMQCPDRLAGDRQQMSIDGYAVAAQTQVHPVLAHLLPLGNKFLPESERVSAFFFFFFTYLLTYLFFLYTLYLYNS